MDPFSNLRTVEIHKNAIVIEPLIPFADAIETVMHRFVEQTMRSQNSFELGDCDGPTPYQNALGQIDAAIGSLKRHRSEMQALAAHRHEWGSNDYCNICGADGRA